jgi:hypothetical protein
MKHWGELTDLETQIIRVGEFKNLFKLLVAGTENYVDIKVLQSAIYTLEGMIDDIDSTLYEKFQTLWDAVKFEVEDKPEPAVLPENTMQTVTVPAFNLSNLDNICITLTSSDSSNNTVTIPSYSKEEDDAFKELEKAMKNWHKATP